MGDGSKVALGAAVGALVVLLFIGGFSGGMGRMMGGGVSGVLQDGLGVGSFEHGWLSENVVSASVVMVGGELREARGEQLGSFFSPEGARGLIVGAKLKTRRADADVPFAASFPDAGTLAGAVAGLMEARPPLWHLALLGPAMARARASSEAYVLFGAYAREHEGQVAGPLRGVVESHRGRVLGAADAHRVWGEVLPGRPLAPDPRAHGSNDRRRGRFAGGPRAPLAQGRPGYDRPLGWGASARLRHPRA
jgi:FAD/FMN-containing dehydrogenase